MSIQRMSEEKIEGFNTQPLMLEIENVIRSGVKTILRDFMTRYELLEKTHNTIMNLPSVRNEMNKCVVVEEGEQASSPKVDTATISNVKDMTRVLVREEICVVEKKLDVIEKKFAAFGPILDKIMAKLHSLNEDVKIFKQSAGAENKTIEKLGMIQPSIVSACENENIKFEIKEEDPVAGANAGLGTVASLEEAEEAEESDASTVASLEEEAEEEEDEEEEEAVASLEEEEEEEAVAEDEEETVAEEEEAEEEAEEEEEEAVASLEEETVASLEEETVASLEEEEAEESDAEEDDVETETEEAVAEEESVAEEEFFEIEIDDVTFCTNDEENGLIYELTEDGEVGDKVGYLKDGEPFFYADEK
jgi:hypothetical protein